MKLYRAFAIFDGLHCIRPWWSPPPLPPSLPPSSCIPPSLFLSLLKGTPANLIIDLPDAAVLRKSWTNLSELADSLDPSQQCIRWEVKIGLKSFQCRKGATQVNVYAAWFRFHLFILCRNPAQENSEREYTDVWIKVCHSCGYVSEIISLIVLNVVPDGPPIILDKYYFVWWILSFSFIGCHTHTACTKAIAYCRILSHRVQNMLGKAKWCLNWFQCYAAICKVIGKIKNVLFFLYITT